MIPPTISQKKRAQKERLLLREIAKLFMQASIDDPLLHDLIIRRVELSKDKSTCFVYFFSENGKQAFDEKLEHLKLYRPSMRKALADELQFRYTPDLRFVFDTKFEKQQSVEKLLDKLKEEGQS